MTTVTELANEFARLNSTNDGPAMTVARNIIKAMKGYSYYPRHYAADVEYLAHALEAYALVLQRAGFVIMEYPDGEPVPNDPDEREERVNELARQEIPKRKSDDPGSEMLNKIINRPSHRPMKTKK